MRQTFGIEGSFPGELRITSVVSFEEELLAESVRRRGCHSRLYPVAKESLDFRVLAQKLAAECGGDAARFADGAERSSKAVEEP